MSDDVLAESLVVCKLLDELDWVAGYEMIQHEELQKALDAARAFIAKYDRHLHRQAVDKPHALICYHYYDNCNTHQTYVGAVWQENDGDGWNVRGVYPGMFDFRKNYQTMDVAEKALKNRYLAILGANK